MRCMRAAAIYALAALNLTFPQLSFIFLSFVLFDFILCFFPQPSLFFTCLLFRLLSSHQGSKANFGAFISFLSVLSVSFYLRDDFCDDLGRSILISILILISAVAATATATAQATITNSDGDELTYIYTSQVVVSSSFATLKINFFCLLSFEFR